MRDRELGPEKSQAFQVSVSTLTLGSLYEAVLTFSGQESFETFWPAVCLNVRWFIPSRRMGVVVCRAEGGFEVVGLFEKARFEKPPRPDFDPMDGELRRSLSQPTVQWIREPWERLGSEEDEFVRWLLKDRPRRLFVLPLRVKGRNVGAMIFAIGRMEEADQAMLNTLGTIYALHVGMTYMLLCAGEERRAIQNQLILRERMASLGTLVAGILHEINTPLGVLNAANNVAIRCLDRIESRNESGGAREIAHPDPFEVLRENARVITAAKDRIKEIVTNLKSFARLDEAECQTISPVEGLETTLTLMEGELDNRITVVREIGEVPEIRCYPGQLNQVFMNLLRNAAEAIEGEGTIRVRAFAVEDAIRVEISDTGRGIAPEKLPRIFEFDFSTQGRRVKMGAGLSIAWNIVQKHGGRIDVASELGRGSTFTVFLPLSRGSGGSDGAESA